MITQAQQLKIRTAFKAEALKVRSVSPEGAVEWKRVKDVSRAEVPWETIQEGQTAQGPFVLTAGHRVFVAPTEKKEMQTLLEGADVLSVCKGKVQPTLVSGKKNLPCRRYMYDLTADEWHNFVLQRSGIVISNSPDKNYHFRPPQHEGAIGQFNRIFGRIWEDYELLEYIERGLDWWNMFPPSTRGLDTVDKVCSDYPTWKTAILWIAITHATFAIAANWSADEFSISGNTLVTVFLPDGISVNLSIEGLFRVCRGETCPIERQAIRAAFLEGKLQVKAVDPETKVVALYPVADVLQHHTGHKRMVRLSLEGGKHVDATEDHSVFSCESPTEKIRPVEAGSLRKGDRLVTVRGNEVRTERLEAVLELPPSELTYDLSVPGPENFLLTNGILAHNSYSIGGVSLDIDKASKYESLKQNAEGQATLATEAKARTVKFIRGLQQPKHGLGVRSAFGPNVARGVLSPRSFIIFPMLAFCGKIFSLLCLASSSIA